MVTCIVRQRISSFIQTTLILSLQVPPWRESWSPRTRRQTVHVAGPTFDSQGNTSSTGGGGSARGSPVARRQRTASVTSASPTSAPSSVGSTPPPRARRANPSFGDYESLDRLDDNYVIMDKSILKVHLPNAGFNVVKCGDATDVKVRTPPKLFIQFPN